MVVICYEWCDFCVFLEKMDIINNFVQDDDDLEDLLFIFARVPRRDYNRQNYFNSFDNNIFFKRFRITKPTALQILNLIEQEIEYPYNLNDSVAPINQLLIFLRFCATGSHLTCVADFAGAHYSTVSRIIVRVAQALARLYNRFVKMPQTENERNESQLSFYEIARFPRVIGTVDCTHIRIQSPGGADAEVFRNRKGYFSVNVQVIASAQLKILNVVARWPGSVHDATIFNNSQVKTDFENNLFPNSVLLGDSGYNLCSYLLTPLTDPELRSEQLYNESHIRTRNTIERLFGVWKRRFPILAYGSRLKLNTTLSIVIATAVIYNICKENNEEEPPDPDDINLFVNIMQVDQVPNIPPPQGLHQNRITAIQVRRNLIDNYFANLDE